MRRLVSHLLLGVGVVLSVGTSDYEVQDPVEPAEPTTAWAVRGAPVTVAEDVHLDDEAPVVFAVTVHSEGEFVRDGEELGPGEPFVGVELEGSWAGSSVVVLWELARLEDACDLSGGAPLLSGVPRYDVLRLEADVPADEPILLAARMPGFSTSFQGSLRVYGGARIEVPVTGVVVDGSGVVATVVAELVPVECGGGDTGDLDEGGDTAE